MNNSNPIEGGSVDFMQVFTELMNCIHQDQLNRAKILVKDLTPEIRETLSRSYNQHRHSLMLEAIILGRTSFLNFLLEEGCIDSEVKCRCDYNGHVMHVSHLGCAAVIGSIQIIKTMLEHGADIDGLNCDTTPVHAASYANRVDVVKFLVENGADVNRPDKKGRTCLMDSVHNVELCLFLVEQGAAVNAANNQGYTALHRAIATDHLDSIQLLMEHGADPLIRNKDGDDALQRAALCDSPEIVEYIIQKMNPTAARRADAYSLFAANIIYLDDDTDLATFFWIKSANERGDPDEVVSVVPKEAYNFAVEARDAESVRRIAEDTDAMYMQTLVVRERILGPDHRKTICGVLDMALLYIEDGSYQRCLDLCKYALRNFRLDLNRPRRSDVVDTLLSLYAKLWRIGKVSPYNIRREDLCDMLQCMVQKIAGIMSSVAVFPAEQALLPAVALHLIYLLHLTGAETPTFRQLVGALVRTRFRTPDGGTLLHVAAAPTAYVSLKNDTEEEEESEEEIYSQAASSVVECLLTAGAAVNAVDSAGNTSLHVAAFNTPETSMTEDREKVIKLLLDHGAHVDMANVKREVASDKLPAVDVFNHTSLVCLAARAIRAYQLPYRRIVPETLADFVDIH